MQDRSENTTGDELAGGIIRQRLPDNEQVPGFPVTAALPELEDIKFADLFEFEDIQQLQDMFSDATGVASLITTPDGIPITKPSNFCRLCSDVIRKTEAGRCNCFKSDAALGEYNPSGPTVQPCLSGGLWDGGVSITVGGKHVANWLIGQVRNSTQDEGKMLLYADEIGADREVFRQALADVPVMSTERFTKIAELLFTMANELSERAFQSLRQSRFIAERQQAEEELQRQNNILSALLQNLQIGVFMAEAPSGKPLLANEAACELLGRGILSDATSETLGDVYKAYKSPGNRPYPVDDMPLVRGLRGEKSMVDDLMVVRPNGAEAHLVIHGSPVIDPQGNIVASLVSFSDITEMKRAEAALRESEQNLSITLQSIGDAVITTDCEGRITRMNPTAERLTGWPLADAAGRPMSEVFRIVNALTRQPVMNPVELVLAQGLVVELANHTLLIARDGREYHVFDSAAPIRDAENRIVGIVLVFSDVTGQYMAREALRASEERLQLATNAGNIGVWDWDVETQELIWGDSMYSLYGIRKEDYSSTRDAWHGSLHPEDRELVREKTQAAFRGEGDYAPEFRIVRPDGAIRIIKAESHLLRDENGLPVRLIGTNMDITERRQEEAERRLLSKAIQQAAEGVCITDADGRIQYVNAAFEALTGYSNKEAIGQTPRILNSGRQDAAFYTDLWETILSGQTWQGQLVNKRKNGTCYIEEMVISPMHDASGVIVNHVAVKRDITHELDLQAQLNQSQKMESIGQLAGGVAHDFNNMLCVILGHAEMAIEQVTPDQPLFTSLQEIRSAANHSANLTRQLLAFARKQTAVPKVIDLNATIEGMLKMLGRLIGEQIQMRFLPGKGLWPINVDPSQIDQILANLCVNARDAIVNIGCLSIETGNSTFDAESCANLPEASPGDYVRLSVNDNGIGMTRETIARIFEPFFTTKEMGKGTGLGLATVYGIVKQNQGFITVDSEPNVGTTMTIFLPRHLGTPAGAGSSSGKNPSVRGHETILLVEDEDAILALTKSILERHGFKVLAATTPDEALRLGGGHQVDLLITDVVMPAMNGRELTKRLQKLDPQLKCLFMSGYTADVISRHGVLEQGAFFIQKPFSIHDLLAKVQEALAG